MYNCIIVDDQAEAVDLISDHVSKIPRLTTQLKTTDAIKALSYLDLNKPDIIFLDIEMPEINGIDFTANLKTRWGNNMPKIVFTTGHSNYALSGYEHGVADYLLKPVTFTRFKQCTDRIIDELDKRITHKQRPDFFFVDNNGEKVKVSFESIIYIEAAGNYVTIVTSEYNKTIYKSMNSMQDILPRDRFVRVHKSFIVALSKVQSVRGNEIGIRGRNGEKFIPVGVTFREHVLRQLGLGK